MDPEKKIAQELSGETARKHIEKITREISFRMAGTEEMVFVGPGPPKSTGARDARKEHPLRTL